MTSLPAWWTSLQAQMRGALQLREIGVYASGGAPFHHSALVGLWGGLPRPVTAAQIQQGQLDHLDVLIMPGGGLRAMSGLLDPLGPEGTAQIRAWVERGGLYIGSCAGAFLGAPSTGAFLTAHPEAASLQMLRSQVANAGEGSLGALHSPGVGRLMAQVAADSGHWLTKGLHGTFPIVHYNGPCFVASDPTYAPVQLMGITSAFTPWERSLPSASEDQALLIDQLIQQRATLAQTGPVGLGQAVLFGSHPEFGFDVLQLGWGEAVRLLANALLASRTRRPQPRSRSPHVPLAGRDTLVKELKAIGHTFMTYATQPPLLHMAPGFMGRSAEVVWQEALSEAAELAERSATALAGIDGLPASEMMWWEAEPVPGQDYGFMGLSPLVRSIQGLFEAADQLHHKVLPVANHPYDHWNASSYHLLASSYLSAAGLMTSAALSTTVILHLAQVADPVAPIPLTTESPFTAAMSGEGVMS